MTQRHLRAVIGTTLGRLLGWLCASALLASLATAEAPTPQARPQARLADSEEPLTPIPQPPPADPRKLALGERLFGDTRLSADGSFSCLSCHDIRTNGADRRTSAGGHDGSSPPFNTLTVFNAALSFRLTWEGRYRDLESQAEASIENPANMHSSVADLVRKLNADPGMIRQFRAVYGRTPDRDNFMDALVTFERSLLTPGSRFDRWLEGDASALTSGELEGYRRFKALGCIACHHGVNVGGNLFGRLGVFHHLASAPVRTMRVPSLRNVAATGPYFHDGSAATLDQAVRRMATAQLNQNLTDDQVASLVSFLNTLTGTYRGKPVVGAEP